MSTERKPTLNLEFGDEHPKRHPINSQEKHNETFTVKLQAMDSAFNGTPIGQATSSFSSSTSVEDLKAATFNFGNVAVSKGSLVAFKLSLISGGSGTPYFCNHGDTTGTPVVQETEDSTPPLSTDRFGAIAIKVEGQN